MWVGWVEMMRIEWFDHRFNLRAAVRRRSCRTHGERGHLARKMQARRRDDA